MIRLRIVRGGQALIVLDTSVLRACGLDSSSADLLRTIPHGGVERVSAPWMVMEELVAQKAVKYRQKYDAAVAAVRAYESLTPWDRSIPMGACDLTRLRSYWRTRYSTLVEETADKRARLAGGRVPGGQCPCSLQGDGGFHALKTGGPRCRCLVVRHRVRAQAPRRDGLLRLREHEGLR
ncbi:hypothetical protein GCM10019016_103020 [Streptomyces prasinosporus]|uniref:PIN domain-containing protein n=1 Tax=Streptomyces prasinosporus TaxID=68256 RepID=A0ABP6U6K5_9ACTN